MIPEDFKIKVALDTNVLAYLIDNTYPNLTEFIKKLSESDFIELICSRFSIYEFIGVRKLENYLREFVAHSHQQNGVVNFSSALKYKNDFNFPELPYSSVSNTVRNSVEIELNRLLDDFGITYENVDIHAGLWNPHKDLVLLSKISKEDSLLILSCCYPELMKKQDYVVFFTNDNQMKRAIDESTVTDVFESNAIARPQTILLSNIVSGIDSDLTKTTENDGLQIDDIIKSFIIEHVQKKCKNLFLGSITKPSSKYNGELLCFKISSDTITLPNDVFLSILDVENLKFYHHNQKFKDFHCDGISIDNYPATLNNNSIVSVKYIIPQVNTDNQQGNTYNQYVKTGNYVFLHPDN
jgi:rRNA-processing protein FCF1